MQAVGIIVEYNPFHNGHKWQVDRARELTNSQYVIGIMSGNFVQRGEPAIFDKWQRAAMAVKGGIDLIIELPTVFAVRSAQHFATGGIRLLGSLGVVSHVCFGAEYANLEALQSIAKTMDNYSTITKMQTALKTGINYAAALEQAISEQGYTADIIKSPNNILAVEYLRAIKKHTHNITPIALGRQDSQYHDKDIDTPYASATAIRNELLKYMYITDKLSTALPKTSLDLISNILEEKLGPITLSSLSNIILAKIRTSSIQALAEIPYVSEGLEYKLFDNALLSSNVTQLLEFIKSKRYPRTRLQRIIIHTLLGTTKQGLKEFDEMGPLYARVLAFNQNGRSILKQLRNYSTIPIITKTTHYLNSRQRSAQNLTPLQKMLAIDTLASDLYVLGMPASKWCAGGWDFRYPPIYIP